MPGKNVEINADELNAKLDKWVERRVLSAVRFFERTLQESFRSAKSGRIYGAEEEVSFDAYDKKYDEGFVGPRQKRKEGSDGEIGVAFKPISFTANKGKKLGAKGKAGQGVHQASAPGEPPAIDTGRLRQSVAHVITRVAHAEYVAEVGSNVHYALRLEYGTKKIKPRPAWVPALRKLEEFMTQQISKEKL